MRSVYVLWDPSEEQVKAVCKTLAVTFEPGCVVMAGVVKVNGRANLRATIFLHDSRDLLVGRGDALIRARQPDVDLLPDREERVTATIEKG